MKPMKVTLLAIALVMLVASSALASYSYDVTINTASFSSTDGSLYFIFNPGPDAQQAYATISGFSTGGTLSTDPMYLASTVTGNLSATGSGSVTFDNAGGLNDYLHGITFGNSLSFHLDFAGPATTAPDHRLTGGSTFSLSLYDAAGFLPLPVSNDPAGGTVYALNLNPDGGVTDATPTPIPAAAWLLGSGLMGLCGIRSKKA
jgi:hypothetical protein